MPIDRSIIGMQSPPMPFEVERGAIRRLARALEDDTPEYQRGEIAPPADAAEAAADLHLVADIVQARLELSGAREAIRADRAEGARSWDERLRAWEAARP